MTDQDYAEPKKPSKKGNVTVKPNPDKAEGDLFNKKPNSGEKGNVIAPKTPGQAEGDEADVDEALRRKQQQERGKG
ncbi:MAG: hypothetical protein H7175_25830 [Burkholderiales bacterium]|nr:hypothetical protein [Anaerolineae bacterium]